MTSLHRAESRGGACCAPPPRRGRSGVCGPRRPASAGGPGTALHAGGRHLEGVRRQDLHRALRQGQQCRDRLQARPADGADRHGPAAPPAMGHDPYRPDASAEQLGSMEPLPRLEGRGEPRTSPKSIHPSATTISPARRTRPTGCASTPRRSSERSLLGGHVGPRLQGQGGVSGLELGRRRGLPGDQLAFGGAADNIDVGVAKFKTLFKDNDCQIINNVEHTCSC